ncbi:MAG TPA: universal stress protein [Kofleriaceae bacterium]|nr:universal stress protein [Kofleriaceae bacterium]
MVVAVDASEYAEVVLEHALDIAARHERADLHLLAVHEGKGADLDEAKRRLVELALAELEAFHGSEHDWHVRLHVRSGVPAEEIAGLAGEVQADLLVIGRFRAKIAEQVLAQAPCPTLVVQLTDQVVEVEEPCADCVTVRADSDGERWFCARHSAPDRAGMATTRLHFAGDWTGGGPMW